MPLPRGSGRLLTAVRPMSKRKLTMQELRDYLVGGTRHVDYRVIMALDYGLTTDDFDRDVPEIVKAGWEKLHLSYTSLLFDINTFMDLIEGES